MSEVTNGGIMVVFTKDEQEVLSHLLTCAEKDLWQDLENEIGVISSTGCYVLNKHYYEIKRINNKLKPSESVPVDMARDGTG
jgi:hypothetical protein|tara:strand:- start:4220 stop:4465 length:246 start_codon:yes stop_codon:yes gene_type:complete